MNINVTPESSNDDLVARRSKAIARGIGMAAPVFIQNALNAEMWDVEGNRFIDFGGGIAVLNTGHRNPTVMKRVQEQGTWTLFSPDEVRDLHDLYGAAFEQKYTEYEKRAAAGKMKLYRPVSAVELDELLITLSQVVLTMNPLRSNVTPEDVMEIADSSSPQSSTATLPVSR